MFQAYGTIRVPGESIAKLAHIETLCRLQDEKGLRLGNRLSKAHVCFKNMIMNV
jgi:hypothetical protein